MISLRKYAASDRHYVLATWARNAHSGSRHGFNAWMARYADRMRELEAAPHVSIVVAEDAAVRHKSGAPTVVGWLAHSGRNFVHYIYVREEYRRRGIARRLSEHAGLALGGEVGHTFDGPALRWLRQRLRLRKIAA